MGPIFEELKTQYEGKPIRFVRFDLTNAATTGKAREEAGRLNLLFLFAGELTTGVMDLVDGKTGKIMRHFGWNSGKPDITRALDAHLAGR